MQQILELRVAAVPVAAAVSDVRCAVRTDRPRRQLTVQLKSVNVNL